MAESDDELPEETIDEAEKLTRRARDAVDEREAAAYREHRDALLTDHGFTARVREEGPRATLVLHPEEWVEDGTIRTDRIDDTGRAIERHLSGPAAPEEWGAIDDHNREIVERVRAERGAVHGDNAEAFADFMGNHYARRIENATRAEVEEFLDDYFVRNAWPSDEQKELVERSLEYVFEIARTEDPE